MIFLVFKYDSGYDEEELIGCYCDIRDALSIKKKLLLDHIKEAYVETLNKEYDIFLKYLDKHIVVSDALENFIDNKMLDYPTITVDITKSPLIGPKLNGVITPFEFI
jgi:hypothetical protein